MTFVISYCVIGIIASILFVGGLVAVCSMKGVTSVLAKTAKQISNTGSMDLKAGDFLSLDAEHYRSMPINTTDVLVIAGMFVMMVILWPVALLGLISSKGQ